jgi:hypothetical protein
MPGGPTKGSRLRERQTGSDGLRAGLTLVIGLRGQPGTGRMRVSIPVRFIPVSGG